MTLPDLIAPLSAVLVLMLAVMLAAWQAQKRVGDTGWVDVFWTFGTGAALAVAALWPDPEALFGRQVIAAVLAVVWSLRLGLYVAKRVLKGPEDARYTAMKARWGERFHARFLPFALIQAPASTLLALSVFVAAHAGDPQLSLRDLFAVAVLVIAIAGEALADEQMRGFKADANHGPVMDRGLWAWSRHPNYFFEWFGWLAWPVMALDPSRPLTFATLIAPFVMYLILRHGTGVPPLERSMLERKGAPFADYQARVSPFFPLPPRRSAK